MLEQYLILLGAATFLVLGTLHLVYTFFTDNFLARNAGTVESMKKDYPVLTRKTTMWRAWIGFNASHSSGAMFIGLVNILLATQHFELYQNADSLHLLNIITAIFYLYLAKKYWFNIPFMGILIATICFITAFILIKV